MIRINSNFLKLPGSYLFSEIAKHVKAYREVHPEKHVIELGIGDVTQPLPSSIIQNMRKAVDDMSAPETFKGYKSDQGYEFLREKIAAFDFQSRGVEIAPDEIFVSTGAKEDTANFQELFATHVKIAIPDPVYPVYIDSNVMAGRTGAYKDGRFEGVVYLDSTVQNNFLPGLPEEDVDLIYLCFPNNPTGQVATKEELQKWVTYAHEKNALILFDAAYESFIQDETIPHSIFEIDGAKEVAVEFRSLSKTAGFTGTRLSYTIVPKEVRAFDENGVAHQLSPLWDRRQATKFNGVAYIIQRGAEVVFTEAGRKEVNAVIDYYLENARIIREGLDALGITFSGGVNSPYIWLKAPEGMSSWDLFHTLLNDCQVVGTPGSGFGKCGEGYFRLTAFGEREEVEEAIVRFSNLQL